MIYLVACTRLINVSGSVKVGCLFEPTVTYSPHYANTQVCHLSDLNTGNTILG